MSTDFLVYINTIFPIKLKIVLDELGLVTITEEL